MLAFLLFAGALHVDLGLLRSRAWVVGAMATFGVLISTVVVGVGFWLIARLVGVDIPLIWAMVFGALISPTDPVAVLSTLKAVRVPKSLEVDMIGESLFNDGVGVVIFTVVLALAVGMQGGARRPAACRANCSSSRRSAARCSGWSPATSPTAPCWRSTTIRSRC